MKKSNNLETKRIYSRMTRNLLLISLSFLVTNFPMFLLQLCHFTRKGYEFGLFKTSIHHAFHVNSTTTITTTITTTTLKIDTNETSLLEQHDEKFHNSLMIEMFERFAYYIYYLNFTINFIIFDRMSILKKKTSGNSKSIRI